ncbi:hypothetical protein HETIRDRAFT_127040 [Heterobasidion irregulare TC 32-1]|uniref:Branched-chain-amino-acid aminotransferase n=1 Tax=Heterobasidion irregulare (strain TC 32-1) TaxID=747525 RepID=W4JN67_HETIT|nr:uncharacterized protein HETIRDRAFT_127040 [Heterobasidion irregulare TC 32-1]ETW74983.1 hypothetical protein HETIRDRAFT_127040 [Heterobasidion irregulare TC 32-1]
MLQIEKTHQRKTIPPANTLKTGHHFTDHMLTIPWILDGGWGTPKIQPYGPLSFEPSCSVFHYAHCLFEGLKAYRRADGRVTMFRPGMHMTRMNASAARITLPTFDGDELLKLIMELVRIDQAWIPQPTGQGLYIRPVLIGTQTKIGPWPPDAALLYVMCSPAGPYSSHPVALQATTGFTRASVGGTGDFKVGANYALGLLPQKQAASLGYDQILWLHGPEHYLTEAGTMNLFVVLKNATGALELVTPPLDGMILPGITRDSVLTIAREHVSGVRPLPKLPRKLTVTERPITMKEFQNAAESGSLLEMFGTGTAVVVSPVNRIGYMGKDIHIPGEADGMGPVSRPLWGELIGRQTGVMPCKWSIEVST